MSHWPHGKLCLRSELVPTYLGRKKWLERVPLTRAWRCCSPFRPLGRHPGCVHTLFPLTGKFLWLKKNCSEIGFRFYFLLDFFPLKLHFGDHALTVRALFWECFPSRVLQVALTPSPAPVLCGLLSSSDTLRRYFQLQELVYYIWEIKDTW